MTPDDIQRVAKALLHPDRLSVVLVGNSAAFAPQLRGVGFGTFEAIELGDLDLTAADFKHTPLKAQQDAGQSARAGDAGATGGASPRNVAQALRPAPKYQSAPLASRPAQDARPEDRAEAAALLDRVIAAKGGLDKLRALKTIVARQTQASHRPDGAPSTVETTNYIEYPNRVRVEAPRGDACRPTTARAPG